MSAKLLRIPPPVCHDVVAGLRTLAEEIEQGLHGDVSAAAWVLDAEYCPVELGLLGAVPSPDALFITLCEAAKLKLLSDMGR